MRRASILAGLSPEQAMKDGLIRDLASFQSASIKIKELGVVPTTVSLSNYADHIKSRFPRGEATEQAKAEIARSIDSGSVASLYYDGKGEKYTLIDKDGKTSKEIYMDPPRISIHESTLSYEFPIYKKADISERVQNQELFTKIQGTNNTKAKEVLTTLVTGENVEEKQKAIMSLGTEKVAQIGKSIEKIKNANLSPEERKAGAEDMKVILRGTRTIPVGLFDQETSKLEELGAGLSKEATLKKSIDSLPPEASTPEEMERVVKNNLSLLTFHKFDRMGGDAQEALDRMIASHNIGRNPSNHIRLDKPIDPDGADMKLLRSDLTKLGITPESVKSEGLASIQKGISNTLQYNPSDSRSLEAKLRSTETG